MAKANGFQLYFVLGTNIVCIVYSTLQPIDALAQEDHLLYDVLLPTNRVEIPHNFNFQGFTF